MKAVGWLALLLAPTRMHGSTNVGLWHLDLMGAHQITIYIEKLVEMDWMT